MIDDPSANRPPDELSLSLQRALDELHSPLRVTHRTVEQDGRSCHVFVSVAGEFGCAFWHRGISHGSGWAPALVDVARAIDGFVRRRAPLPALYATHDWIEVDEAAMIPDAAAFVDAAWGRYLACEPADEVPDGPLAALFAAAARRPRLRALLPFTSMYWLCFSRTTGYPYTRDCPYAEPIGDGRYRVRGTDGSFAEGDAEQAAALLDAGLPAGCGPAIEGTADDLEPPGR